MLDPNNPPKNCRVVKKTCEGCGKTIYTSPKGRYCTDACRQRDYVAKNPERTKATLQRYKIKKGQRIYSKNLMNVCEVCNKKFNPNPNNIHMRFCSKECYSIFRKEYHDKWKEENRDKRRKYSADYAKRYPERIKEIWKRFEASEKGKANRLRQKQKPGFKERRKKAEQKHRASGKRAEWEAKHRKIHKNRINDAMCTAISRTIHNKGGRSWQKLVNYTREQLMNHLEKQFREGMSWDNYGEWQVDHIRPIASFNFNSAEDPQFKECWALNNLQPLWAEENLMKADKY